MKKRKVSKLTSLILSLAMTVGMTPAFALHAEASDGAAEWSVVSADDFPESDGLLAGYLQEQVDERLYGGVSLFGTAAGDRLAEDGLEKAVYSQLKAQIADVAAGERESTVFAIDEDSLSPLTWTAEQLGCRIMKDGSITDEAKTALAQKFREVLDTKKIMTCLLEDCPYELYWFDKTGGMGTFYGMSGSFNELKITSLSFSFSVAGDYRASTPYTVDAARTGAARAAANIAALIREYDGLGDRDKLEAYRAEICGLVSYNHTAAGGSVPYGDPWQLIYVFDRNPATNVVCEGYAKAFQYLCDNSRFDGGVACYSVTGDMNGGAHMWNVVNWNGKHYLADVTNCDDGMIGAPDLLFLVGVQGEDGSRTHVFTLGTKEIVYRYDTSVENLICDGYPALSPLAALTFTDDDSYDIPASAVGIAISDIDVSGGVSGGTAPYTFSAAGLPDGLSISPDGVIAGAPATVCAAGTAVLTVTDGAGARKRIAIAFGGVSPAAVPVTGVTVMEELEVAVGKTVHLTWDVSPADATLKTVSFTSDTPGIAAVDSVTGEVTGIAPGRAVVTVRTADGGFTARCAVRVFCSHAHKTETAARASDCREPGWSKYYTCGDCGRLLDADGATELEDVPYLPLAAHIVLHQDGTPATHETAGRVEHWVCRVCGACFSDAACTAPIPSDRLTIPVIAHGYGAAWERDGQSHWHACECGSIADQAAHTFGGWTVTREATASEPGERERVCLVCGQREIEEIPAGGRPDGPDVLPGDLDGSGEVTIQDVMEACKVLARKSAGRPPSADEMARGDLNQDGAFVISDVMEICKILARKG